MDLWIYFINKYMMFKLVFYDLYFSFNNEI